MGQNPREHKKKETAIIFYFMHSVLILISVLLLSYQQEIEKQETFQHDKIF